MTFTDPNHDKSMTNISSLLDVAFYNVDLYESFEFTMQLVLLWLQIIWQIVKLGNAFVNISQIHFRSQVCCRNHLWNAETWRDQIWQLNISFLHMAVTESMEFHFSEEQNSTKLEKKIGKMRQIDRQSVTIP